MVLVKILISNDGEPREKALQYWHAVFDVGGCHATVCQVEAFGEAVSGCKYETKTVKRGGITCPDCLDMIKTIKSMPL